MTRSPVAHAMTKHNEGRGLDIMATKKAERKGFSFAEFVASTIGMTTAEAESTLASMGDADRKLFAPLFDRVEDEAAIDFLKTALAAAIADNVALEEKSDALIRAFAEERVKLQRTRDLLLDLDKVIAVVLGMIATPRTNDEPNFWMQVSHDEAHLHDAPLTTVAQMLRRALDGEAFAQAAAGAALGALLRKGGEPTYRCGHTDDDCPDGCPRERGLHLVRDTKKETIQ